MNIRNRKSKGNIIYFTKQRNEYVLRILQEIRAIEKSFKRNLSKDDFLKEIGIIIISSLLRKLLELELTKDFNKNNLNSIIHVHMLVHMKDGSIFVKSDSDIKNKRKGFLVNHHFMQDLKKQLNKILKSNLEAGNRF